MRSHNFNVIHFGIVCAVDEEFESLKKQITVTSNEKLGDKNLVLGTYQNYNVAIIQCGIGNINSAAVTSALIARFQPKIMLFSGIAGALNTQLEVGDVLIGSSAFQAEAISHEQLRDTWEMPALDKPAHPELIRFTEGLYQQCQYNIQTGIIVSSDIYPAPKDYQQLFLDKKAYAIDMETVAFYQTCNTFSIPCLCIRSFSNPVTNAEKEKLQPDLIVASSTNSSDFCFKLIQAISIANRDSFTLSSLLEESTKEANPNHQNNYLFQYMKYGFSTIIAAGVGIYAAYRAQNSSSEVNFHAQQQLTTPELNS